MSGSDGEDGRRERTTITGESGTVMGDSGCSAKIAVKQCANGEVPCDGFVGRNRDDSARMCADKAALNDDDRNMLLFPAAESTGYTTTDQAVIDAFIKNRFNMPQRNADILAKYSAAVDSLSRHEKESCSCDIYKAKRDMFRDELQKAMKFQNLWIELRQHMRSAFNTALEAARVSESSQCGRLPVTDMHDTVIQLCKMDPHQLFMKLVSQAQEFVVEIKVRLFALLHDQHTNNLAEIFLTGLLDDYDALVSTATKISELVKPLKEYLFKFNLTWDCFVKKLYQIYVYNDVLVQTNVPMFLRQLKELEPLKNATCEHLVDKCFIFKDEMKRIGNLWLETESWMDKYNAEQAVRMTRLRQIREAWELFTTTRKLMERSMLNKAPDIASEMQEIHGQFSSLIAHTSGNNSRALSPALDFNSESIPVPPSIEIVQILLDDWNKAQHQKLADIAGALTANEMDAGLSECRDKASCYDNARATCQSTQHAIRSISDDPSIVENRGESGKKCDFGTCSETDHVNAQRKIGSIENIERNDTSPVLHLSNGFPEDSTNCTVTQEKKKVDNSSDEDKRRKSVTHDSSHNETKNDGCSNQSESKTCSCVYEHAREIAEKKKEVSENPPCPCLLNTRRKWDTCPCLNKLATNSHPKATSPVSVTTPEPCQKPAVKTGSTQSAQTQTRHSTTQTPSTAHNHHKHQGRCNAHSHTHSPLSDLTKNTAPSHPRLNPLNHIPHACHKQANVEHIKIVSCNDISSGDCSDSGSSQEDSCSTSSSAQRDTNIRHCDCCYCEVFGNGMPPVNRNYKRAQERLRQLLSKKKARKCKSTGCSSPKSPSECSPSVNPESKVTSSIPRSTTPIMTAPAHDQRDQRDLEKLLEFIEGNQSGKKNNNKKAEKKARQKQRRLEEKLKKDKQETEKQKLLELQKKTPEVTITVVDPQKPIPPRLFPQCNLPEVSILPTSPSASALKQLQHRKKDKQEISSNSSNSSSSNSIINLNNKPKSAGILNAKNKSINSIDKCETRGTNSNQGNNKNHPRNDKADSNKSNKSPPSINNACAKNSPSNNVDKSSDVDLLDKTLTKKERKKLKKEMKKLEEAKAKEAENAAQAESQPQIVTIRREMNSNSAEPTVTITLKGQTPAEDKVLFTLVNGQSKEPAHAGKAEQDQSQSNSGKKKKVKTNNNSNGNVNSMQQANKLQQSNNLKQQMSQVSAKGADNKNLKQLANNEKSKANKQTDEKKAQQQSSVSESKSAKSKKNKKNTENKENMLQQQNTVSKSRNQPIAANKKQSKASTPPQTPVSQKQQQNQNIANESATNNKKGKKQQQQQQQQQQQDKNQSNASKNNKNANASNKSVSSKNEPQKSANKVNQIATNKQHASAEVQPCPERVSSPSLSSQLKEMGPYAKINIEDLKLPPGITITKVDAPPKPLPIRTSLLSKPVNSAKQAPLFAASTNGMQSSYASPQAGGNVIVVDTGKLKQDLLPKANEKDVPKDQQSQNTVTSKKKKKKKKNKNSDNATSTVSMQSNDTFGNEHVMDEPARILHNPGTNMVTIRNPSFGPMKVPPTQQAAIIKMSENGMVTIRSPALQQAINAGLASPSKPDYIVKGDLSATAATGRTSALSSDGTLNVKHANGVIPASLADLRSRFMTQSQYSTTPLSALANISISKVTNGQPIPENGINLKGTSVTLTKVRPETADVENARQAAKNGTVKEAAVNTASITAANNGNGGGGGGNGGSGKSKKKKKRGSSTRQCGDDWNLVESVFAPKDIDLENGEMDDAERELEAFKRFCFQSVPLPRKEKVNLNIKDIVLKKKSSSSSSSSSSSTSSSSATTATSPAATVIAAN